MIKLGFKKGTPGSVRSVPAHLAIILMREGAIFSKDASTKVESVESNYAKPRQALWGPGPLDYQLTLESYIAKEGSVLEDFTIDIV